MSWNPYELADETERLHVLTDDSVLRLRSLNQQLDSATRMIRDFRLERAIATVGEPDREMREPAKPYWVREGLNSAEFMELETRITEIEGELEGRFGPDLPLEQFSNRDLREKWSLGSKRILLGQKRVLRGRLILGQDIPLVRSLRSLTVLFFKAIPIAGLRDELIRENHGHWGYHYHYCIHKRGRSDTILSFGGSSTAPTLFHETHGEHKAQAEARPYAWKAEKRQSIHGACLPDLRRWKINDFKVPGAGAGVVWPL